MTGKSFIYCHHFLHLIRDTGKICYISYEKLVESLKVSTFHFIKCPLSNTDTKKILSLSSKNNKTINVFGKFNSLQKLSNLCPQIKSFRQILKIFDTIQKHHDFQYKSFVAGCACDAQGSEPEVSQKPAQTQLLLRASLI